jgi:hypothetical protein
MAIINTSKFMVALVAPITVGFSWGFSQPDTARAHKFREPASRTLVGLVLPAGLSSPVDQDDSEDFFYRGENYRVGNRVGIDLKEAAKWYRLAATKGHANAQIRLGLFYQKGYGVSQDFILSYVWYSFAAASKDYELAKYAEKKRDEVDPWMTSTQLAHAKEMVRRCQQSKFAECD